MGPLRLKVAASLTIGPRSAFSDAFKVPWMSEFRATLTFEPTAFRLNVGLNEKDASIVAFTPC